MEDDEIASATKDATGRAAGVTLESGATLPAQTPRDVTRPPDGTPPRDVVVVGGGPGGLSTAINVATETGGLNMLLIEASPTPGGQPKASSRIEDYGGFPVGVSGAKLMGDMCDQAVLHGTHTLLGTRVTGLSYDPATRLKTITLDNGQSVTARVVVLAVGLAYRSLDFPGADARRISYGDEQTMVHQSGGGPVIVLGDSDGAAQAALGAARIASSVTYVSGKPITQSISPYRVQMIRTSPKITVIENDEIASATKDADGSVSSITLKSGATLPAKALGIFVGLQPDTSWLPPEIKTEVGKIVVDMATLATSIPGVFAVGDARVGSIPRIASVVGDGTNVARSVLDYFSLPWGSW